MADVFEGKPDSRQSADINHPASRFRPTYRQLTAEEKVLHDEPNLWQKPWRALGESNPSCKIENRETYVSRQRIRQPNRAFCALRF